MDEQDGAIAGQPDAETALTGPHGVEEDAGSRDPQEGGYRAAADDDSPTAGTVLPGDEDAVRSVALQSSGAEDDSQPVGADNTLDLGLDQVASDAPDDEAELESAEGA